MTSLRSTDLQLFPTSAEAAIRVASVKQVYIRGVVKVLIDASARVRLVVSISLVRWTAQVMVLRPRSPPSSPAPLAHRCAAAGR